MSNNTKIFSEAIAEAKAIRETAMANAKLALEEAFAPRIQEMMSTKLEALAEEDVNEDDYQAADDAAMDAVNAVDDEISLEELLAELDGLEEGTDMDANEKMEENAIAEVEVKDEEGSISVDELKDIIRDIMSDIMGGGEEEGAEEEEAGEEEVEGGEEMSAEDDLELEEILAEIASLEEDDLEEGVLDTIKGATKKVGDTIKANVGDGGKMDQFIDRTYAKMKKNNLASPYGGNTQGLQEEELEEAIDSDIVDSVKSAAKKMGMSVKDFMKNHILGKKGESSAPTETSWNESAELEEAMNTISTLRSELNEVNLLNAKLLYVNKLFKAKNLNEAQKVKVINAFDRAETVREAKNVFDTLSESLNAEKAKSQIKESLSFASKASGVSDRQPIMEGNDFVARMQKLAGII